MGVEYTLVNHQDKTCYEVGRGSWYAFCDQNGDNLELLYQESIFDIIREEIFENDGCL